MKPPSYVGPESSDLVHARIRMCVYSHPGEGKTVFWSSGGQDVLFINSDPEGTISGTARGNKFHQVDAYDWDDMDQVYDWLKGDQPKEFKWIVWDSLTLFQDEALHDDIMVDASARKPDQDQFVPSQREYLISINKVGNMVRQLAKLPYNLGVSCHVMTATESGGDGTLFMPQVQGKNMPSKVSGYMNVVGYLGKAKNEDGRTVQRMQFVRQGRYYAKDRWDALGQHLDRPTLPKVEKAIEDRRAQMLAGDKKVGAKKSAAPTPSTRRRTPTKKK